MTRALGLVAATVAACLVVVVGHRLDAPMLLGGGVTVALVSGYVYGRAGR